MKVAFTNVFNKSIDILLIPCIHLFKMYIYIDLLLYIRSFIICKHIYMHYIERFYLNSVSVCLLFYTLSHTHTYSLSLSQSVHDK